MLIKGLRDALITAGTDKVKLATLIESLNTEESGLATAVTENPLPPA